MINLRWSTVHWVTCTLPASPPASMLLARVTSLLHTSYLIIVHHDDIDLDGSDNEDGDDNEKNKEECPTTEPIEKIVFHVYYFLHIFE